MEIQLSMNYNLYEKYGLVIFEIGNSRLKIVINDKIHYVDYTDIDSFHTNFELILNQIDVILKNIDYKKIYYASVNPQLINQLIKYYEIENIEQLIDDFPLDFSDITGMGIDRKLGLIAAKENYGNNIITIDCGTAQTYNLLVNSKCEGGFITPGLRTRINSVFSNTNIIEIKSKEFDFTIGKNTKQSIYNGIYIGLISEIKEIISIFNRFTNTELKVLITGGNSEKIFNSLNKNDFSLILYPNLVTDGINILLSKKYDK